MSGSELFIVKKSLWARARSRREEPRQAPGLGQRPRSESDEESERRRTDVVATLANRSIESLLQPIMDLKSGRSVGVEALSRFAGTPVRPPDVWFAEASSVGLGVDLEILAISKALEHLPRLPSGLYLSINASAETIVSDRFHEVLADAACERVVLEITEHAQVTNYALFRQKLSQLRSMGLRLAVDDAGAGYASFRHVLNLRPDVIKLDIGLTRGIDSDPARQALGSALLAFGLDAYNAAMVAEGIETAAELDTLRALGCPLGQGFYLGRPGRLRVPTRPAGQQLWSPGADEAPVVSRGALGASERYGAGDVLRLEVPGQHADGSRDDEDRRGDEDDAAYSAFPDPSVPDSFREDYAQLLALAAEIQDLEEHNARRALLV